jgi:ParB/RepB/Spo0J family partition protein
MKTVNAEGASRGEIFMIPPGEIIVEDAANGRRYGTGNLDDLIESILAKGQLEPVEVRRDDQGRPVLNLGYRRVGAIRAINEAGLAPEPMRVACLIRDRDPLEAFGANVEENCQRNDLSAIDYAFIIERYQDGFELTQEEIGKRLRKSQTWVSQTVSLLVLPADVQKQIHAGRIPAAEGYRLAQMPKAQRLAEIERARAEPSAPAKARQARDGSPKPRPLKVVRKFWRELADSEDEDWRKSGLTELAGEVCQFLSGKLSERQMFNRLAKVFKLES